MKQWIFIPLISLFIASSAWAEVKTRTVDYKDGKTVLQGYLAWDDGIKGQAPGVLIIHDWNGLDDYEKSRARQIAGLGYVAFALDMYGKNVHPANAEESGKESSKYKNDRPLMRQRAMAGLKTLMKQPHVSKNDLAVMGYCFGGTTTLELARSGAPVNGAVSFHGHLDTPDPDDAKNIKGKILVLHGGDDPYVPELQIVNFIKEMQNAKVNWQMTVYGNAVHSFTNPAAGNDNSKGSAYNEQADKRSWQAMKAFYKELFD